MKLLCWNVRGVGSQGSLHRLKNLVRKYKPKVLCLLEPFREEQQIGKYAFAMGFERGRCEGNGKIWIFWDRDTEVQILEKRDQMITIKMGQAEMAKEMNVTFVYASCDARVRQELWERLEEIAEGQIGSEPWGVVGDFNCILRADEKRGGLAYNMTKSAPFQHCIDRADLRETTYYGNTYTWWNGRQERQAVWKKLDRCLVNGKWEEEVQTYVQHLSKATSDHSPLVVNIEPPIKLGRKQFSFLNAWLEHEQCLAVVEEAFFF